MEPSEDETLEEREDVEAVEDEVTAASEDPKKSEERRLARKPNINHLVDAVAILDDGTYVFIPEVNEKVIIERQNSVLRGRPWLDTRVYIVVDIDDETGVVKLWDQESRHFALTNYITGVRDHGFKFKLMPPKGNPLARRRRRRERLVVDDEQQAA